MASHKRELVAEAQRLAEQEGPAQQRADQAKQLQQRWRELGRAPKGVEQPCGASFVAIATPSSPRAMRCAASSRRVSSSASMPCRR
ncbi:DUF349 domain-containing protein [Salinicola tamaricis]|uniref:DUF349 domain-containing protein n=1 Tax=Salinicola tamaricis TaxID=1771309 RepID=UPI003BF59C57